MNNRQIRYRIKYEITKRLKNNINVVSGYKINEKYKFKEFKLINSSKMNSKEIIEIADNICNNKFTFLNNMTYQFQNEIDWELNPFEYRLWNFNLNYFDFLENLAEAYEVSDDKKYIYKGIELINSWIFNNQSYNYNTWDSYVVSKRIYNIINFISYYRSKMKKKDIDNINVSIFTQGEYLINNIEYYLDANHVIMDAKGIIFFGVYCKNEKIIKEGMSVLLKEYKRQVLQDGGHYERSPSYQVEVLSHYVESYILLKKNNFIDESKKLLSIVDKMSSYLQKITMPNGNIPLLNDSSLDYPFEADNLLQVSSIILNRKLFSNNILSKYYLILLGEENKEEILGALKKEDKEIEDVVFQESGYYILKDLINEEEIYVLIDCGDGGPDYNLGHTHADSLSILVNIGGKDLIIDSGTFTYKIGEDRNRYRSTLAHNTVEIDNKNSSDVWGGFRVGKRAKSLVSNYVNSHEYSYISAYHDGYCKVLKKDRIIHKREIVYVKGKALFIIDSLLGIIKNNHKAIINYNVRKENFNSKDNKFITNKNTVDFGFNKSFDIIVGKYSDKFSLERECLNIRSQWEFDSENTVITSMIFNNRDIECSIDKEKINIFEDEKNIIEIKR